MVNEAEASYSSYKSTIPNLLNNKVPSNDFDPKREELEAELRRHFYYEKSKRSELARAATRAYDRYKYYERLAIQEAEED